MRGKLTSLKGIRIKGRTKKLLVVFDQIKIYSNIISLVTLTNFTNSLIRFGKYLNIQPEIIIFWCQKICINLKKIFRTEYLQIHDKVINLLFNLLQFQANFCIRQFKLLPIEGNVSRFDPDR